MCLNSEYPSYKSYSHGRLLGIIWLNSNRLITTRNIFFTPLYCKIHSDFAEYKTGTRLEPQRCNAVGNSTLLLECFITIYSVFLLNWVFVELHFIASAARSVLSRQINKTCALRKSSPFHFSRKPTHQVFSSQKSDWDEIG